MLVWQEYGGTEHGLFRLGKVTTETLAVRNAGVQYRDAQFSYDLIVEIIDVGLLTTIHHRPEQAYLFGDRLASGHEIVLEVGNELERTLQYQPVGTDGDKDIVHL